MVVSLKTGLDKVQSKYDSLQSLGYLKVSTKIEHGRTLVEPERVLWLQTALAGYKAELAWLKVENEENLHAEITETLDKFQKVHDDLVAALNNRQQGDTNRAARCQLLNEQINDLKKEMANDTAQKQQMRRDIAKDEDSRDGIARNVQKIVRKLEICLKNIKELENDMAKPTDS